MRVHWLTPCLAVGALLCAALLAVGHHKYYMSLNNKQSSGDPYKLFGNQFSQQQFNLAIGNTFALLVRSCLALSSSAAFCQLFWSIAKRESASKRPPTLSRLDIAHSTSSNIFNLFYIPVWYRYPLLCCVAVVCWSIPIATIIAPATLSVTGVSVSRDQQHHVPRIDFDNLNFVAGMKGDPEPRFTNEYRYKGPSTYAQQAAIAVAAQGAVLPIEALAPNSTWEVTFRAPSIQCNSVDRLLQTEIERSIMDYVQTTCIAPIFSAWYPRWDNLTLPLGERSIVYKPYDNSTSKVFLEYPDLQSNPDIEISFVVANFPHLAKTMYIGRESENLDCNWPNQISASDDRPLGDLAVNASVLECRLFNSTYNTKFKYENGRQHIDTNVRPISDDEKVRMLSSVIGPTDWSRWREDCGILNILPKGSDKCIFDTSLLRRLAYQSALQAFTMLFTGYQTFQQNQTSRIMSTKLIHSKELASLLKSGENPDEIFLQDMLMASPLQNISGYSGIPRSGSLEDPTPLHEALETMFQNIVVSFMSSSALRTDYTMPNSPDATSVTVKTWELRYSYSRVSQVKLWLAYGISIALTCCTLVIGAIAIVANDATYSNNFSTVLLAGHGATFSVEVAESDKAGRDPLPAYLGAATVKFRNSAQGAEEIEMMSKPDASSSQIAG